MNHSGTTKKTSALYEGISFDGVEECIHCGLCLDSCPTYRELGTEQDSPRGRLDLMRGLWEGVLQPSREVHAPLQRCLDCRACETACPSSVAYGDLLEKTRFVFTEKKPGLKLFTRLQNWLFDRLLGTTSAMVWFSRIAKLYQKVGIARWVQARPLRLLLPRKWVIAHSVMPHFEGRSFKLQNQSSIDPNHEKTVALFTGCVMDVADHEIHAASMHLLRASGVSVSVPPSQGCCGALHAHRGFGTSAGTLAQRNQEVFPVGRYEAVIVNAAGCGAQLKTYRKMEGDHEDKAQSCSSAWGEQITDLFAFLAKLPNFAETGFQADPPVTVLYDAPCHLIHAQKTDRMPRQFLASLPGVTFVPLSNADFCCGAAGIYNLSQPHLSQAILEPKLADIAETLKAHPNAKILLSANPGCLYQLRAGVARQKLPIKVQHPAVFAAGRLLNHR